MTNFYWGDKEQTFVIRYINDSTQFIPATEENEIYREVILPWLSSGNTISPCTFNSEIKEVNWNSLYIQLENCDLFNDLINISIVYPEISTILNLVILVITTTKSCDNFQKRLDNLSQLLTQKNIEINPENISKFNSILESHSIIQRFNYPYSI